MPAKKTPSTNNAKITAKEDSKRPPVVVICGHVDHGKSTLLDYIRKSNIVAGEAGGITQHLGAYEIERNKDKITFLDTPGHEAFCSIRERGANVADLAILVVSGEDGVKPQTLDALRCIKSAEIPYIVAINKIDKPGANIERTKQSLGEHEIYVEGWGGDIPCVPISAINGTGVDELLDVVLLLSEMKGLVYDKEKEAEGFVIEAKMDSKKGITSTILIKNGTLNIGDFILAGDAFTPVRQIEDSHGKSLEKASASSPIRITGWNKIPVGGINFVVVKNKKQAEEMSLQWKNHSKNKKVESPKNDTDTGDTVVFPIIIKADVIGSLEGIINELKKIKTDGKVKIKIVSEGIGNVNENDVKTAITDSRIIIIAFNAKPDKKAETIIERTSVNIKNFNIIYELIQFIKDEVTKRTPKEFEEKMTGRAKILAVFSSNKDKRIVGGKVQEGMISVGSEIKILRRDTEISRGKIRELQQSKKRVDEVKEGYEFGSLIESKIELVEGDKIECFSVVEKTNYN